MPSWGSKLERAPSGSFALGGKGTVDTGSQGRGRVRQTDRQRDNDQPPSSSDSPDGPDHFQGGTISTHLFIHSFHIYTYLVSTYYVPGPMPTPGKSPCCSHLGLGPGPLPSQP